MEAQLSVTLHTMSASVPPPVAAQAAPFPSLSQIMQQLAAGPVSDVPTHIQEQVKTLA